MRPWTNAAYAMATTPVVQTHAVCLTATTAVVLMTAACLTATTHAHDCAGVPYGDAFLDCAGTCTQAWLLIWIGDGFFDDGTFGYDFVSCDDFNCDNGTELIDGACQ